MDCIEVLRGSKYLSISKSILSAIYFHLLCKQPASLSMGLSMVFGVVARVALENCLRLLPFSIPIYEYINRNFVTNPSSNIQ